MPHRPFIPRPRIVKRFVSCFRAWDLPLSRLLLPEDDSTLGQVVRREFDLHAIARQDADEVHAQFAGDMVTVEMSPYDLTKGRITWRTK